MPDLVCTCGAVLDPRSIYERCDCGLAWVLLGYRDGARWTQVDPREVRVLGGRGGS